MHIEDVLRRCEAAGWRPLPHQVSALSSDAEAVCLVGGPGSGKTFTLGPWMLSRDPEKLHGLAVPTFGVAKYTFRAAVILFDRLGVEYVFNRRPPIAWGTRLNLTSYRNAITIRGGASFVVLSMCSRQWRGFRLGSVFIDEADSPILDGDVIDGDEVFAVADRAERVFATAQSAGVALARLGALGRVAHVVHAEGRAVA